MAHEIHQHLINAAREHIQRYDLCGIQELYNHILTLKNSDDHAIDLQYLYQRILLISLSTKGTWSISKYLLHMYPKMDYITQIALKPTLIHAKYTVHKSCRQQYLCQLTQLIRY